MTGMILAAALLLQTATVAMPKVTGPIEGPGVMYPGLRDAPRTRQGSAHEAMPYHERGCRPLLLGERQELCCKLERHVAVECDKVGDPEAEEDREQQQRIFGRLSERFRLFDVLPKEHVFHSVDEAVRKLAKTK